MPVKKYRIDLDVTSTEWSTASAYVEAESEDDAREKFEDNPDGYDWGDWEIEDSEVRGWSVGNVEIDE